MGYQDYCARCGESYDSDNLMTCQVCGGDVCYRCFGRVPGQCARCDVPPTDPGPRGESIAPPEKAPDVP